MPKPAAAKYSLLIATTLIGAAAAQATPPTAHDLALTLFKRLTGVAIGLNDPRLAQMEQLIGSGQTREAAAIATDDDSFYNITVRDFSAVMSNHDESSMVPLNDFQAMIVGVTRDGLDARTLLSGNFTYQGGPNLGLPDVNASDNDHYKAIDDKHLSLKKSLVRVEPQRADLQDTAGLLTSRAWAEAHYNMGTNRRSVEYSFREFMCTPIQTWRDFGLPDYHVRRDVDRSPGGNAGTYEGLCRTCHAPMDSMAGAFARFDFTQNQLTYLGPSGVAAKYNQNADHYPDGYVTVDDSWINYATKNHNEAFGWRGTLSGRGVREFGTMLASSQGFKACMARRAFKEVCKRDALATEADTIKTVGDNFETGGYQLRHLFEEVAVLPACLGG